MTTNAAQLAGRTAIVTGAGSGIGAASAIAFAQAGATVLAVDRPGVAPPNHPQVHAFAIDVAEHGAAEAIVARATDIAGRLDILFNNAGVASNSLAQSTSDEDWARTLDVNLSAPFRLARAAIAHLAKAPAGRIINTASVMANITDYGLSAYCASKSGILGLTRTLAVELGKYGVTVNAILPGAIRTGMTGPLWQARPDIAEVWAKKAALRRLGEPDDIARVAVFLASDAAGFVTGQAIAVDGGLTLRV